MTTSGTISYLPPKSYKFYRRFEITHQIATINFVPLGGTRYARMILSLGAGYSTYYFEEKLSSNPEKSYDYDFKGEVSGNSELLGICGD